MSEGATLVFALSLIPTGFLARASGRAFARNRDALRFAGMAAGKRYQLDRLRALRRGLITELDLVREDYLRHRDADVPSGGKI
jgi:hypothetical protein